MQATRSQGIGTAPGGLLAALAVLLSACGSGDRKDEATPAAATTELLPEEAAAMEPLDMAPADALAGAGTEAAVPADPLASAGAPAAEAKGD